MLWSCNVGTNAGKQTGNHQYKPNVANISKHFHIKEASFMYWLIKEESISFGNFSVEYVSDDLEGKLLSMGYCEGHQCKRGC